MPTYIVRFRYTAKALENIADTPKRLDAFKEFLPETPPEREGDAALLNGPKLEEDVGHVSQDDIDALFP